MYKLVEEGGALIYVNGTPAACSIVDNRDKWGCTAFYQPTNVNTPPRATVVPYPYGSTPAPQISFEHGYLKNVVPGEMEVSIAPSVALQAQAIAARSYGWNKSGDLNNSTSRQLFVPYRFEYLRVEGGDTAHNNRTEGSIAQRRKRLGRAASAWKRQHPEDWEWECFGQQNPAWLRYEKQVTVQ